MSVDDLSNQLKYCTMNEKINNLCDTMHTIDMHCPDTEWSILNTIIRTCQTYIYFGNEEGCVPCEEEIAWIRSEAERYSKEIICLDDNERYMLHDCMNSNNVMEFIIKFLSFCEYIHDMVMNNTI